jgi:hypothetical protein
MEYNPISVSSKEDYQEILKNWAPNVDREGNLETEVLDLLSGLVDADTLDDDLADALARLSNRRPDFQEALRLLMTKRSERLESDPGNNWGFVTLDDVRGAFVLTYIFEDLMSFFEVDSVENLLQERMRPSADAPEFFRWLISVAPVLEKMRLTGLSRELIEEQLEKKWGSKSRQLPGFDSDMVVTPFDKHDLEDVLLAVEAIRRAQNLQLRSPNEFEQPRLPRARRTGSSYLNSRASLDLRSGLPHPGSVPSNGWPPRLNQEAASRKHRHKNRRSRLSQDSISGGIELNEEQQQTDYDIASREEPARPVNPQRSLFVDSDDDTNRGTLEVGLPGT